jgi:hypothetical protein
MAYVLSTVVPAVEASYRTTLPRSMLGVDMAGPFTFHLAFNDAQYRFTRIASQSGRFGWGGPSPVYSPYVNEISQNQSRMSPVLKRVTLDWSSQDFSQVQDTGTLQLVFDQSDWNGKVCFNEQDNQYTDPWANLRARLPENLTFLLNDLVTK